MAVFEKSASPEKNKQANWSTMLLAAAASATDHHCLCPCHPSNQTRQTNLCIHTPGRGRKKKRKSNNPNAQPKQQAQAAPRPAKVNLANAKWIVWSAELDKTFAFSILDFCNLPHDTKKICSNCVTKWRTWMKNNHPAALAKFNGNSTILPCLQGEIFSVRALQTKACITFNSQLLASCSCVTIV